MSEEKLKLRKRIEHWAGHNDDHIKSILEAADNADSMGLKVVAEALRAAAVSGKNVSKELRKAEENVV